MKDIVIDAENAIVGRLATEVAQYALCGTTVHVLNCDKAIMSGKKDYLCQKYLAMRMRGQPRQGVYIHRNSDRFLKRIIKGMLPKDKARGVEAGKRIKCWRGVPEQFKDAKMMKIGFADRARLNTTRSMTVGDLCKWLGASR